MAVRAPHGVGKTALASWVVCWALSEFDRDLKVITTASAWRQLTKYLWPEIRKWAQRATWPGTPPDLLSQSARTDYGEAFPVASNNPALIEGAHADVIIYILDEAKAIPAATWDAIEGAFSAGESEVYVLAISTAGEPSGRFYDICSSKPGYEDWSKVHITLDEAIQAGRMKKEWAEQRKRQWGEKSAVYQNRVLGNFSSDAATQVIPLSWVEAANMRWHDWVDAGAAGSPTSLGVDVGGRLKNSDATDFAPVYDRFKVRTLTRLPYLANPDTATMETAGQVAYEMRRLHVPAWIDVIGIGSGVVHRCRELGLPAYAFHSAERTTVLDNSGSRGFLNWRAAGWWTLREFLDPISEFQVCLPPDDELTGDLCAPGYIHMSSGDIKVEAKDDIKGRLGRSTNAGDAVVYGITGPILEAGRITERSKLGREEIN